MISKLLYLKFLLFWHLPKLISLVAQSDQNICKHRLKRSGKVSLSEKNEALEKIKKQKKKKKIRS